MSAKYDRQIDILNILMRGERTTVYKLSCELGVCTHTIKRDLADLSYHFPIFTYAGRGGGVEMSNCFAVNARLLRRDQVLLIAYSLRYLARSEDEKSAEARTLLYQLFHE